MASIQKVKTYSILVKGRVQGIGFRPFIYLKAKELGLVGQVKNTKQGVLILCQGERVERLINILKYSPPPLSEITEINIKKKFALRYKDFKIQKSSSNNEQSDVVQIMPDLAVCKDCVRDFEDPKNRRFFYPFTNCTQCGPRYSIIYSLPYDRPRTTMRTFRMCKNCAEEYTNPTDRRFHAQPNACPICGPWITLTKSRKPQTANRKKAESGKRTADISAITYTDSKSTITKAQKLLKQGKIIAIKSIGGFLLACDAKNERAVRKLRLRKYRPFKPLAIMCKDLKTVKKLCYINREEVKILKSQVSPIVLLRKKRGNLTNLDQIAPKNGYLGVMLPYTPLHKLLFSQTFTTKKTKNVSRETLAPDTLVMTSANPKNEPIIANSDEIRSKLKRVVDYILDHNRPIESRCDDSVVFDYKGPVIIRYSRGYVPQPIYLQNINLQPVLAFGSDLKNSFALGQGNKVYLSPFIGDLASEQTVVFLFEMVEKYEKWFGIKPKFVATDLHPEYISNRIAEQYAKTHNVPLAKVQHHFAHLLGVMAENGLVGPVIGVSYDGTGYGNDGNIWGGEIMVLDYFTFNRITHLKYMPLFGGDVIVTNPRLLAKSYLQKTKPYQGLLTSSMGRLFDAVASILDLCHYQTFEGEAPIALEAEAMKASKNPKLKIQNSKLQQNDCLGDPVLILKEIIALKKKRTPVCDIALYFHQRIINQTISQVKRIGQEYKIKTVCLSGGVFQNRIILSGIYSGLEKAGFKVYINRKVPINDGGTAFGQAVFAGLNPPQADKN